MPINDEKRRELKRKSLLHTRMRLEEAREKGFGVNFTSYMAVEEYEPKMINEELTHAEVEVSVLEEMIRLGAPQYVIIPQIDIIHRLTNPRKFIQQAMSKHKATSIVQLKGIL